MESILNPNDVLTMIKENSDAERREKEQDICKIEETAKAILEIIKGNIKANSITKVISAVFDKSLNKEIYLLQIKCFRGGIKKNEESVSEEADKVLKYFKNLLRESGFLYGEETHVYENGHIYLRSASIYTVIDQDKYEELYHDATIEEDERMQEYYDKYLAIPYHQMVNHTHN